MNDIAKSSILEALMNSGAEQFSMPDLSSLEAESVRFDNPFEAFCESVKGSGGKIDGGENNELTCEIDSYCVKGAFGVAENGAVWIENSPQQVQRRDLFIHERLVIVLDKTQIVNNMHDAYIRLGETSTGYGIFISGPSKTADIEQALVFGAHGPREVVIKFV